MNVNYERETYLSGIFVLIKILKRAKSRTSFFYIIYEKTQLSNNYLQM